jgi:hypothetical protein
VKLVQAKNAGETPALRNIARFFLLAFFAPFALSDS